jgi:hypothetical protein
MSAFRRHLRQWAAAWMVFQAVSLSMSVPLDACAARIAAAADRQVECHGNAAPAPCPMRAADGVPCPMHRGTVHDHDQQSREACSMRGTCDRPVAALFALLFNQGVLTHLSEALPDRSQAAIAVLHVDHPHIHQPPPDSPPPRA